MQQPSINLSLLHVGATVYYHLSLSELPTNPQKLWCGLVVNMLEPVGLLYVESLEPGYKGLHEHVWVEQIVSISNGE